MLAVVSPAKTLDYQTETPEHQPTEPLFPEAASKLADRMRMFSSVDLKGLMGISERLAELNAERFSHWQWPMPATESRAAVFAFKGDVYAGLNAYDLSGSELDYLQSHLRILSGLYGLLRPLDRMLPYRLEMGTRVDVGEAKDLYGFWGDKLAAALHEEPAMADGVLINLASNEYFRALAPHIDQDRVITPVFKDYKNGRYKVISFFAKKARGMMVRYMAEQGADHPEALKGFTGGGYQFDPASSSGREFVFLRREDS